MDGLSNLVNKPHEERLMFLLLIYRVMLWIT